MTRFQPFLLATFKKSQQYSTINSDHALRHKAFAVAKMSEYEVCR